MSDEPIGKAHPSQDFLVGKTISGDIVCNPHAKAVRTPQYKMKVIPDKRKKNQKHKKKPAD